MELPPIWLANALDSLSGWMLYKDRLLKGMAIPEAALVTELWTSLRAEVPSGTKVNAEFPYEDLGVRSWTAIGRKPAVDICVETQTLEEIVEYVLEVKRFYKGRNFSGSDVRGVEKDVQRVGQALASCPDDRGRRGFVIVTHQNLLPREAWCRGKHGTNRRSASIQALGTRSLLSLHGEGTLTNFVVRTHSKALPSATTRRGMWVSLLEVLPTQPHNRFGGEETCL